MLKSSISPHIHSNQSIERSMWGVNVALLPALIASVYFFGTRSIWIVFFSVVAGVVTEALMQLLFRKPVTILDGAAVVTGILVAFNMPPQIPFYIPVVATVVGLVFAKHLFGGLGNNIFNAALVGRVFVMFAWLPEMTTWNMPLEPHWIYNFNLFNFNLDSITGATKVDGITSATPLAINKLQGMNTIIQYYGSKLNFYKQAFLGNTGGCIGETSELALLIGASYLFWKKIIFPIIPFFFIATVFVMSALMGQDPMFHILSGGLFLGAFFMATDYVTTPLSLKGSIIYGMGCGFLTVLLRLKSGLPEGVSFSILLMNGITPLIDKFIKVKPLGQQKIKGK